jgi:tryptophan 2,3-dioxygenase
VNRSPYDPAEEGAQMAFDGRMSYTDYLGLDAVLSAQRPAQRRA